METRILTADDLPGMVRLGGEAFGARPAGSPPPDPAKHPQPGRHDWGTLDRGDLVAKVTAREYASWFHGTEVATTGVAGVAVRPESRGQGLLDDLFGVSLEEGHAERGEVLSTLYPTAPGIYRRFGYELITSYDSVEVPTSALAAVRPAGGTTLRRAVADDVETIRGVYDAWAAAHNGPLTRRGPSFAGTAAEVVEEFTGVTLASDGDGRVVGYCSWDRGEGYDEKATIEVTDLLATTADGLRALLRMLGSFSTVTGRVRFWTSGTDPVRYALPSLAWPVVGGHAYMLRVHDVAGALSGLTLPDAGTVRFSVEGDLLGTMDGAYELSGGASACAATDTSDGPVFSPRGLALAYAGAASCATIRAAGLMSGPATHDATIDGLLGAREVHVRDYF